MDLAKSIGAQITLALRTPMLSWDSLETRSTRKGQIEIHRTAALPAWVLVGGGLIALIAMGNYFKENSRQTVGQQIGDPLQIFGPLDPFNWVAAKK